MSGSLREVVFCPYQGAGHVNPALVLAEKLGVQHGIRSRILLGGQHLWNGLPDKYKNDRSNNELISIEVLDIGKDLTISKSHSHRLICTGVRKVLDTTNDLAKPFDNHMEQICIRLKELSESESPPLCVLLDFGLLCSAKFSFWAPVLMPRLRICIFSPMSVLSVVYLFGGRKIFTPDASNKMFVLPNMPPFFARDIPPFPDESEMRVNLLGQIKLFDAIVFNSCEELESGPLTTFRELFSSSVAKEVYPLGPLLDDSLFQGPDLGVDADNPYKKWLDLQPPASVLFICFGSWIQISEAQIRELAAGLESSKHRFLWVIPSEEQAATLPEGFKARTSGQGLVMTGFAPQKLILSHEATGGFVSVCGWNSIVECASLGGIPMLCWPIFLDQLMNCRYVVDGLKIGVEVIGDEDGDGLVSRSEVESAVRSVMEDKEMQSRAKALKNAMRGKALVCPNVLHKFVTDLSN